MAKSWKFLALLQLAVVAADIQVYPKSEPLILVADFLDEEANFGEFIPKRGVSTMVVLAEPENGCSPLTPPPNVPNPTSRWAVLMKRYNCTFEEKAMNAQNAFYDVLIVHNVDSNKLEIMNASNPEHLHIMSVFITGNAGREIKMKYLYENGYVVRIEPNSSNDLLGKILIPFVVIISASFILMVGFMVVKCIKDQRRARRRRLPYSSLNKIPTAKFRKNDPFETCAICLDDFIEGEKLRILPCSHAYHCKCIDPWLTGNRRVCPMCKRKVFVADERTDSDDSSSEDDDHTPLMRGRGTTYGGTSGSVRPPAAVTVGERYTDFRTISEMLAAMGRINEEETHQQHQGSDISRTSSSSSGGSEVHCITGDGGHSHTDAVDCHCVEENDRHSDTDAVDCHYVDENDGHSHTDAVDC